MEPIPESVEAMDNYGPFDMDVDLLAWLRACSVEVETIAPDCIGLSLAMLDHGVTFTLVASSAEIAVLDALQYLGGGPCVTAVEVGEIVALPTDSAEHEEADWQLFALGTAAASVRSTLTLPIVDAGLVTGSINMYAASSRAFDGKHEQLAGVFDAWAPGAVTNADMSFRSRAVAEAAPALLRDDLRVQVAVGLLAEARGLSYDGARNLLRSAALRAGLTEGRVADVVLALRDAENGAVNPLG